jgi:hypothetical protein
MLERHEWDFPPRRPRKRSTEAVDVSRRRYRPSRQSPPWRSTGALKVAVLGGKAVIGGILGFAIAVALWFFTEITSR